MTEHFVYEKALVFWNIPLLHLELQRDIVYLRLGKPIVMKIFIKRQAMRKIYLGLQVPGLVFHDGHVKLVCDLGFKILEHLLYCFSRVQKRFCNALVDIDSNLTNMKTFFLLKIFFAR